MKNGLILVLTLLASGAGFYASWLWFKSGTLYADVGLSGVDAMEQQDGEDQTNVWGIVSTRELLEQAAILNQKAALWTGASVALGAVTALVNLFWPCAPCN